MTRLGNRVAFVSAFLFSLVPMLFGCKGEIISPTASIDTVQPQVVCPVQKTTPVKILGTNFTPLPTGSLTDQQGLELPRVLLSQRTQLSGAQGAGTELRVYDGQDQTHVRFASQNEMQFDVYPAMVNADPATGTPGEDLSPGLYDVVVQNPDDVRALKEGGLAVVPPPVLSAVTPNPSCNEQAESTFTVTGQNLLRIGGTELPTVVFAAADGTGSPVAARSVSANQCQPIPSPQGLLLELCLELQVAVDKGALVPTTYRATATNPGAADCSSKEDVRVVLIPAPIITTVKNLAVCSVANTTLVVQGQNFLQLAGPPVQNPIVSIGGQTFQTTTSNCTPIVDAPNASLCQTLQFTVPTGTFANGTYPATILNPGQNACSTSTPIQVDVVSAPTVTNVSPKSMCMGGGTLTITGTKLYTGGSAVLDVNATTQVPSSTYSSNAQETQALAGFSGPLPVGGPYNLIVRNQAGCEISVPAAVTITPGPAILFVDPPAIPNVTTIQATVYATSISPPIKTIAIAPTGTSSFTNLTVSTNPVFPNRATVTIPAGMAAGVYDMKLDDQSTCSAFLQSALKIVATPTLTVTNVTPGFGSTGQDTGVVITGTGFVSTPRAYLTSATTPQALALAAVTYQSATSLSAVVRSGLAAGTYDLLVVNPDGSFGIKKNAFVVTLAASPPPVITSIAPSSFVTATATPATISGSGFRTGATLTLSCQDANGNPTTGSSATAGTITSTSIAATFTATGVLCIVRVANTDGTFFDYSAIGVTNASLNLTGFKNGTNLTIGRRALAAFAGRPTPVARFVYALGGDNGQNNQPMASVEAAPTALNGDLGAFFALPKSLPKALSFQGVAVLGRFVYAVGGFDGAAAVRDVYRAEILNPLNAPQVEDVDVKYSAGSGLTQGLYTYRLSAVMSGADANNPNGETLASDFFPIQVPALSNGKVQVCVFAPPAARYPGAASFNVYRSPKANDPAGKELFLGNILSTKTPLCYLDDGTITPSGASPYPLGATGVWKTLPQLATARIGAGAAIAQDPGDASKYYLYATGGNSGTIATPASLASVEVLPIALVPGGQNVGTWSASASTVKARWALTAVAGTAAQNSVITGNDTYLYVSAGSTTSVTTLDGTVEVAKVQTNGVLAAFSTASSGSGMKRPASGVALVNNQMMTFGGFQAGAAVTNSDSANLNTATSLANFNALGSGTLKLPRALAGTAMESAFIYQLGGANGGVNSAQNTTEQTIW
jgi:hypothetical protein